MATDSMTAEITKLQDAEFGWQIKIDAGAISPSDLEPALKAASAEVADQNPDGEPVQLWLQQVDPQTNSVACDLGFTPYRDLWQLRAPLPIEGDRADIDVETFDIEKDLDEWVEVNRRAFWWHPEQGKVTKPDVQEMATQDWFDANGFFLQHEDGELVGFCWTKIHRDTEPNLGEIYAIAVDPDHHGKGLGGPLTRKGLDYLADQGLEVAMLYVEADNTAANRVYMQLGFRHFSTDRAYRSSN